MVTGVIEQGDILHAGIKKISDGGRKFMQVVTWLKKYIAADTYVTEKELACYRRLFLKRMRGNTRLRLYELDGVKPKRTFHRNRHAFCPKLHTC